jgi:two-component system cell cycle sensor histidine kinase/response regulator CckA
MTMESHPAVGASDPRLDRLTENAEVVMIRYRLEEPHGIDFVSPSSLRILGYSPEEFYAEPGLGLEIVHPDDRERLELEWSIDPEAPFLGRAVRKDGRVCWVERRQQIVWDEHGASSHLEATLRDVTQQVEAAAALQRSEQRWSAVFDAAIDVFLLADDDRRLIAANPAASEFFGIPMDEIVRRRIDDILAPHELPDLDERWRTFLRQGFARGESTWRRHDGVERSVQISATANVSPGQHLAIVHDITGQRAAEDALRDSETRFRTAFASAPIGMALVDTDGSVLEVNQEFCRVLGYDEDELVGTTWQALTHPDDLHANADLMRSALAGEVDAYALEKRYLRKDGGTVWGRLSVALVRADDGQPRYFIGQLEDVSELRRLEAERRQGSKLESLGRLAAGIAHDFNNMLTAIRGYTALTLEDELHERSRARLYEIDSAAERAAALTRQLLAFGRKQVLDPRVHELNAIVASTESLLRHLVGESIRIRTELRDAGAKVRVDRNQLEQAIVNLVVNARDAMPAGGTIEITTFVAGEDVGLSVRDTGSGIAPEVRERLFEPFVTTKSTSAGSGLGLAGVYGFVTQSGGRIEVDSIDGAGTTFTIYLATATGEDVSDEPAPVARPSAGPARAARILVAEDEEAVRRLLCAILRAKGHTVIAAASGEEALAYASRPGRPAIDLLLTDVVMPGTSGPDLLAKLREREPDLPGIYMSGYSEDAVAGHGELLPRAPFIEKPFTAEQITATVDAVLDAA